MTNQDANRPQRIKIIIISVIAAILVFIIGAWLITSAIKSVEKKQSETKTSEQSSSKDENKTSSMRLKITQTPVQTVAQILLVAQIL